MFQNRRTTGIAGKRTCYFWDPSMWCWEVQSNSVSSFREALYYTCQQVCPKHYITRVYRCAL